jgi:hypothetical protein
MVGYDLDLEAPRRYNEKFQWRKIRDRNPLFPIVGDKVGVRAYAAERLGRETVEAITIPHLFVADHPDRIPFDRLPDAYVIKASHASGWNLFVRDGQHPRSGPDRERLLEWVNREFGQNVYEWAYTRMPRRRVRTVGCLFLSLCGALRFHVDGHIFTLMKGNHDRIALWSPAAPCDAEGFP